ncbi:hypothetical protein FE257_007280 [Aspergillus nanangensis]|uniref:Uncharacterized protein n=1 Tax=Aspergillus nanangensis TaxID=2582783 RepID=A0AAD4GUE3_ASPNN|nr:hypothetical protein FE257_007280 [Aspergillus nanangensis]
MSTRYHEKKVDEIVGRYLTVSHPNQALHYVLEDPGESSLLLDSLRRQISLVKCRSQNIDHGQVTIYDKALLVLTKYGEKLDHIGALELYATEYLGIVPISSVAQNTDIMTKHIELQRKVINGSASDTLEARSPSTKDTRHNATMQDRMSPDSYKPRKHHRHRHHNYEDSSRQKADSELGLQRRVERILDVYYQAKDKYFYAMQLDGMVSLEVARFLRDSAENALRYLTTNGLHEHKVVSELEQIFNTARDKTAELLGGRKRHFDEENDRRRRKHGRRHIDSYRPHS